VIKAHFSISHFEMQAIDVRKMIWTFSCAKVLISSGFRYAKVKIFFLKTIETGFLQDNRSIPFGKEKPGFAQCRSPRYLTHLTPQATIFSAFSTGGSNYPPVLREMIAQGG
jgi:hypothetical protein